MPRRLGLDKKELDGAGCKNKSPKTQGSELTHTHICERNSPNWEEIVVSWAPGRHFPRNEEWELNLFTQ